MLKHLKLLAEGHLNNVKDKNVDNIVKKKIRVSSPGPQLFLTSQ